MFKPNDRSPPRHTFANAVYHSSLKSVNITLLIINELRAKERRINRKIFTNHFNKAVLIGNTLVKLFFESLCNKLIDNNL